MINGVDVGVFARRERVEALVDEMLAMTAPPAELLAAARNGIEQIDRIASSAPTTAEELELLDFSEPLEQLAEQLEPLVPTPEGDRG